MAIEAIGWRYAPVNAKDGKSAVFAGAFLQALLVSGKMLLGSFWSVPAYTEKFFETVIQRIFRLVGHCVRFYGGSASRGSARE